MKITKVAFLKMLLFTIILPSILTSCLGRYSDSYAKMIANNPLKAQDGGFNQAAWKGMKMVFPSLEEELDILYPDTQDNPSMITRAITKTIDDGYRAIILPGFTYDKTVSQKSFFDVYNSTYFLAIDVFKYEEIKKQNKSFVDKYYEILVDESKPGFAAGVDVGLQIYKSFIKDPDNMSLVHLKKNDDVIVKITAIGGLNIDPIKNYGIGFNKGINWVKNNIIEEHNNNSKNKRRLILEWHPVTFNGGFGNDDSIKGAQANTKNAIKNNVGVIFNISVPDANTALKEIADSRKNIWFVGVDVDQSQDKNLYNYKHFIKTSALKDITNATKQVLTAIKERINNDDQRSNENNLIKPGTNNFIWNKDNQDIELVPMNNEKFEQFWGNLLNNKEDKIRLLKEALSVNVTDMRSCSDKNNPVFESLKKEDICYKKG